MTAGIVSQLREFFDVAGLHPEAPEVFSAYDRVFQFDLVDGPPFYVEIKGGRLTVSEGTSGLDWMYENWEEVTCVRASASVIEDAMSGNRLLPDAFFDRELGFAPNRAADTETGGAAIVCWFYTLFRLGLEQARNRTWGVASG